MLRILAIEPDPERGRVLAQLVRERVGGDVLLAESTSAAIAAMSERAADLILTSVLLPPSDDAQLTVYLKEHDRARNVSVLIVPAVVSSDQAAPTRSKWPLSRLRRQAEPYWPAYDPEAVAGRIREAVESYARRAKDAATGAQITVCLPSATEATDLLRETATLAEEGLLTGAMGLARLQEHRAHRAHRLTGMDLPWLSSVTLPWGLEVQLLNISSSGLLIESRSRLAPGQATTFQLWGPNKNRHHRHHRRPPKPQLVVPARIVRSESKMVGGGSVRYQAAAAFESTVNLLV